MEKENYSNELKLVLNDMENIVAKEYPTLTMDIYYFILAAMGEKNSILHTALQCNLTQETFNRIYNTFAEIVASKSLSAIKPNRTIKVDAALNSILDNDAEIERETLNDSTITTEHVFLAILNKSGDDNKVRQTFERIGINYKIFRSMALSARNAKKNSTEKVNSKDKKNGQRTKILIGGVDENGNPIILGATNGDEGNPFNAIPGSKKRSKGTTVTTYCTNLNEMAENGNIDKLIGRDREIRQIINILGRRKKNSLVILGNDGVGKTAIAENLAYKIVNGDVPLFLKDKILVSLDMTALVAGTTLRGMFEERVKGILDDIKADPRYILLIDNIGNVMSDKGKNDYDISSMLGRSIENGEVQVIGTADFKSYRSAFEKNAGLSRRFQKIIIEAPTVEDSKEILNGVKSYYEDFHRVKYTNEAINACVDLAHRYITERNLPDSGIDLMDEAGALISISKDESDEIKNIRREISNMEEQVETYKSNEEYGNADEVALNLRRSQNILKEKIVEFEKYRKTNPEIVDTDTVLKIVSDKTGIPTNQLTADDKKRLLTMEERLKEEVVGQDEAIKTICKALKRNRIGLTGNKCGFSGMLIGKTGVGKSLIAKKIAKELFGDETAMVRFDMSEYPDKSAVNKLIGSNPGYIGYEEGGQLTEAIKNRKHCVLLLDEIEKADPEIYNLFLQVLDEGFLTDNSGMKVDFKNVIILFTSNAGAKAASDFNRGIGFNENETENTKRILLKQLKNKFPPEFLNRLDSVIYFNNLTEENLKTIIDIEIKKVVKKINEIGYKVEYDSDAINFILDAISEEKEYGARPIIRAIQENITDKITDLLLETDYEKSYKFNIIVEDKKIKIS